MKLLLALISICSAAFIYAADGWGGNDGGEGWGPKYAGYNESCEVESCNSGLICSTNNNGNKVCLKNVNQDCGGFAGFQCGDNLYCEILETNVADAMGTCKNAVVCDKIGTKSEGWYSEEGLVMWDQCKDKEAPAVCGEVAEGTYLNCNTEGYSCYINKGYGHKKGICVEHSCINLMPPKPDLCPGGWDTVVDNYGCITKFVCAQKNCGGFAGFVCNDGYFCQMTETYPDAMGSCVQCPAFVDCEPGTDTPNPICANTEAFSTACPSTQIAY